MAMSIACTHLYDDPCKLPSTVSTISSSGAHQQAAHRLLGLRKN